MRDAECVQFLQWALPRLHMRWPGFRKVRRQVCKRIGRRMRELGMADIADYRAHLELDADEWLQLDAMCRITISRFYRDRGVFDTLRNEVLPALLRNMQDRGDNLFRAWSAGCGSGEEPYTLAIMWGMVIQDRFPDAKIEIISTDADPVVLERARAAHYAFGSLKDLPADWRERSFARVNDGYLLRPEYKHYVTFLEQDIRENQPPGPFDLLLCRNLAFTYFDEALQFDLLNRIVKLLHVNGVLVIGAHENLPASELTPSAPGTIPTIYQKNPSGGLTAVA